ncbi:hypothetical protein HPB50_003449 [Hyalomma asiaticum]|uniref:Uncharacterized protein n=1 Tax=Hyalomma asiaticum TaxID=266040 RepID=A0ACB7SMD1_HYAAI|nr:hypothetical protein HPB50_003449 [Hyalomma asiaticum]
MAVTKLLLALVCSAFAWPQTAQCLALHKTKRPTTVPAPAISPESTVAPTEAPVVNSTVAEDAPLTRQPLKGTWTTNDSKSWGVSDSVLKTSNASGSNESEPLRGNATGESFLQVSGSGQSGSGWSSWANDTAGSGSGWGWGSSGNGGKEDKASKDGGGTAWGQGAGFKKGNWGAVKGQGKATGWGGGQGSGQGLTPVQQVWADQPSW